MRQSIGFIRPLVLLMLCVLIFGLVGFWMTYRPVPTNLRIAAAQPGGQYTLFASALAQTYSHLTSDKKLKVIPTQGSQENLSLIQNKRVDFAIIQHHQQIPQNMRIVCPIHVEATHLLVRNGQNLHQLGQFKGKAISIGLEKSGMRQTANKILTAYGIKPSTLQFSNTYFT